MGNACCAQRDKELPTCKLIRGGKRSERDLEAEYEEGLLHECSCKRNPNY